MQFKLKALFNFNRTTHFYVAATLSGDAGSGKITRYQKINFRITSMTNDIYSYQPKRQSKNIRTITNDFDKLKWFMLYSVESNSKLKIILQKVDTLTRIDLLRMTIPINFNTSLRSMANDMVSKVVECSRLYSSNLKIIE